MTVFGDQAMFLHSINLAALAFFFAVLIQALLLPWVKHRKFDYAATALEKGLWLVVLMPWLVSVASFFVAFHFYADMETGGLFHFHHAYRYELLSWHSIPSLAFMALLFVAVSKTVLRVFAHYSAMKGLAIFSGSKPVNQIDTNEVHAFTSGFIKPRVYLSKGLAGSLDTAETRAVVEHETAHQLRRDPLRKLVFSFFVRFFPNRVGRTLIQRFHLVLEQSADEYAARQLGDETTVAAALLKMAKLFKRQTGATYSKGQSGVYCAFVGNEIRERLHYLLDSDQQRKSFPYVSVASCLVVVAVANLFGVDAFHHFTESFFHH